MRFILLGSMSVRIFVLNFAIACVCFISGRLGFLMAIQPGLATILWPGSGIALACVYLYGYRVLPGVFAGASGLALFSMIGVQELSPSIEVFVQAFVKGLWPMLQAGIPVAVLYKVMGKETRLESFTDVTKFIVIGGFLGCFISATFSFLTMYYWGVVSFSDFYSVWITWYIGDVLGVLVFGPIVLVTLCPRTRVEVKRKLVVSLSLVVVLVLYVSLFGYVSMVDKREAEKELESNSMLFSKTVELEFRHYITELYAFQGLVNSAQVFNSEAFMRFSDQVFEMYPAMESLHWSPLITRAERAPYEARMRVALGDDFSIFSYDDGMKYNLSDGKDTYFPVTIFKSRYPNKSFKGYDLSSDPQISSLIHQAIEEGHSKIQQASFTLSGKNAHSVLAVLPVYRDVRPSKKAALGVVSLVFSYDKILSFIVSRAQEKNIEIFLDDPDGMLWNELEKKRGVILKRYDITVENARYTLIFCKKNDTMSWSLWYALGASVMAVSLFSGFILMATGQLAVTKQIVTDQTNKLRQSSKFLQQVMDNVPDYIFVKNRDSEIITANKAFFELYAPQDRQALIGATGLGEFPKEHQAVYLEEDRKAFEQGASETYEDNIDYKGVLRRFLTRKKKFSDEQGNEFILGIARDMTEFLLAQNKLQSVFDHTVDGLLMVNNEGEIDAYNRACQTILGYEPDDVIGKNVRMFKPQGDIPQSWVDDDTLAFDFDENVLSKVLEKGSVVYVQHKTGRIFPIHLAVSKIVIGGATFFSAIIRDISKEKTAEEELKRSNRELEAFAYIASHDLKAPLRHISMSAEFLKQRYGKAFDESGQEFLDILVNSSHRMADMIESLMAYSRVGNGDAIVEAVSLNKILNDTLHVLQFRINEVNAQIDVPEDLPDVEVNANLIGQLFQNLIDNALKYQPEGQSPVVRISMDRCEGGYIFLNIQDNGIGISEEYKEKIFSIFQRLHNSDSYTGTGVGLSICKRIAEFHKGDIYLNTNCIQGTCFVVKLPLA